MAALIEFSLFIGQQKTFSYRIVSFVTQHIDININDFPDDGKVVDKYITFVRSNHRIRNNSMVLNFNI